MGVDARVDDLGLLSDGSLEAPAELDEAGWWSGGSAPGLPGPTVLVAHRDSATGPALFYELPFLQAGDSILVTDKGGRVHEYVVDRIEQHPRDQFPTSACTARHRSPRFGCSRAVATMTRTPVYERNYVLYATAA